MITHNIYFHEEIRKNISLDKLFTLGIWTSQFLAILVLKFKEVQFFLLSDFVSTKCWMSGKQCKP